MNGHDIDETVSIEVLYNKTITTIERNSRGDGAINYMLSPANIESVCGVRAGRCLVHWAPTLFLCSQ